MALTGRLASLTARSARSSHAPAITSSRVFSASVRLDFGTSRQVAVALPGSLPQIRGLCFPCGLRLFFNGPPQPLAERNQRMPVTQSERNFAGLLVHGGVGIRFV